MPPTARNNKTALSRGGNSPGGSGAVLPKDFPARPLCPPGGADPDDPRSAEGRAQTADEAPDVVKQDPEGPDRRRSGGLVGV